MHRGYEHEHDDEPSFGASRGRGRGQLRERSDGDDGERDEQGEQGNTFMAMTRRDVRAGTSTRTGARGSAKDLDEENPRSAEDLVRSSLREMSDFLGERETCDPTRTLSGLALTGGEILAGAALAGFLAQRFRQAGAVIPVGVTLGIFGLAAAQFNMLGRASTDLRNVSLGALASAAALWAAGRGVIAREETVRPDQQQLAAFASGVPGVPGVPGALGPATGGSAFYGLPPAQSSFAPAAADFQNLVARRPF